jgi:hypothetical protein
MYACNRCKSPVYSAVDFLCFGKLGEMMHANDECSASQ